MTITLTAKQGQAVIDAKKWFTRNETNGKDPNRMFKIAGFAGTGKTTVVSEIIGELGLSEDEVVTVAYTGMATSVLMRKGNKNASTIHKLIYDAVPIEEGGNVTKFEFTLKDELDNKKIKLIVLDEASMANEEILTDLKSFRIPIIAVGDTGQLEPISGASSALIDPDVFLDEIVRQALDNPIIYLSMLARQGQHIQYGQYGDSVQVVSREHMTLDMFSLADQIIAGRNATVQGLNKYYRNNIMNIQNPNPIVGDKLICLKNDWNYFIESNGIGIPLVNGLLGTLTDKNAHSKTLLYHSSFRPIFADKEFHNLYIDGVPFVGDYMEELNEKRLYLFRKPIIESKGIQSFDFGYAITCHKSQGSEFNNLLLINEVLNRRSHPKWLYTGITRAKENLILVL